MKLMKSLALVAVCFCAYLVSADNLERFVPEDTTILIKMRPQMLLDLPVLKDDGSAEIKKWRDILEALKLPSEALALFTPKYMDSPTLIMPATTTPAQLKENLDNLAKEFPGISVAELPDNAGFRLNLDQKDKQSHIDLCYLGKDIIVVRDDKSIPLAELKAGAAPAPILANFKDFGKLEVVRIAATEAAMAGNPSFNGLNSLFVKIGRSADKNIAFILDAALGFSKAESAAQFAGMAPFILGMAIMQGTNDQALAEQVGQAVRIKADGAKVLINATASETLINTLKEKFQKGLAAPAAALGNAAGEQTAQ
jgi:hypothetical protein